MTAPLYSTPKRRALGGYGLFSRLSTWLLRQWGWQIDLADPLPAKCVWVMYPHTSNWDFPLGLLCKWAAGLSVERDGLCFAGKESLFKWPWGGFFRKVGGFPVKRSSSSGFVEQMAERFKREEKLLFVLAPEGTRKYTPSIRSSFYYVALEAKVPIALGTFDYRSKRVTINTFFTPTGDVLTDLQIIADYYKKVGAAGATAHAAAPWTFHRSDAKQ